MDLNELKNNAKELVGNSEINDNVNTQQQDVPALPGEKETIYEGPGLVVEATKEEEPKGIVLNRAPSESIQYAMSVLEEMDREIEELKAKKEAEEKEKETNTVEEKAVKRNDDEEDEEEDEEEELTPEELEKKYEEAKVIIDKTGMGAVIEFTEEERAKLERAKVIKLEEIENVQLETIKIKKTKLKKGQVEKIIKKKIKAFTTPIVLPASGYTAVMSGCSTHELIALMQNSEDPIYNAETKWSLIHDKLVETSIGNMDFNTFLHNTAAADYNVLLYGIICATYPEQDKLSLSCLNRECRQVFDHTYDIRSLLRIEKMSQELQNRMMRIIDNSYTVESAKAVHEEAPLSNVKRVRLPDSEIIVEFGIQSAYDFIYKSIKELSEIKDAKYNQASVLSSVIRRAFIPDDDGEYIEVDSPVDVANLIYNLRDIDITVITKMGEEMMKDITFEFGFMNVKCPKCGTIEKHIEIPLEQILFFKYQQALNTKIIE